MDGKTAKNQAQRLLQALISEGHYIFDTVCAKHTASALNIPETYIPKLLASLVKQGYLLHLRRGLYAGTGQLPGQFDIPPLAIATHLVSPSAISHWSALHYHGLTEQIPQHITAMTPKKITPPTQYKPNKNKPIQKHLWEVAGIYYEYLCVKPSCFFGFETVWLDEYFSIDITDKERTVLELFASPRYFGGMGETLGITESSLNEINIPLLIEYAIQYDNAAAIKRLGWSLEYFGISTKQLKPLYLFPIKGYRLLDPTKPNRGRHDPRWMIRDNLTGKNTHETLKKPTGSGQ